MHSQHSDISRSIPAPTFIIGCLFILVVAALQVWRSAEPLCLGPRRPVAASDISPHTMIRQIQPAGYSNRVDNLPDVRWDVAPQPSLITLPIPTPVDDADELANFNEEQHATLPVEPDGDHSMADHSSYVSDFNGPPTAVLESEPVEQSSTDPWEEWLSPGKPMETKVAPSSITVGPPIRTSVEPGLHVEHPSRIANLPARSSIERPLSRDPDPISLPMPSQSVTPLTTDSPRPTSTEDLLTHSQPVEESKLVPQPAVEKRSSDETVTASKKLRATKPVPAGLPVPALLLATLSKVHQPPAAAAWATRTAELVNELSRQSELSSPESQANIEQLGKQWRQAKSLADQLPTVQDATLTLQRRLQIWQALPRTSISAIAPEFSVTDLDSGMLQSMDGVDTAKNNLEGWEDWKKFLLMDELREMIYSGNAKSNRRRLGFAEQLQHRMTMESLTESQRQFLADTDFQTYLGNVRNWALVGVTQRSIAADIEAFEADAASLAGMRLALLRQELSYSNFPGDQRLGELLEKHYRSGNVCLTASQAFINRLTPAIQHVRTPFSDYMFGGKVRGLSNARTQITLELRPSPDQIQVLLRATGTVAARSSLTHGKVRLFNQNNANFVIEKQIMMNHDGIGLSTSQANATSRSNLLGIRTGYDALPVLGGFVRRAAEKQHAENNGLARRIFEHRVISEAREELDRELNEQLARAKEEANEKLLKPLQRLNLDPTPLQMQTEEDQIVFRGRLAGPHQLASYAPRPVSVEGSLCAVQIHQSAVNNFVQQLDFDGAKGTFPELVKMLCDKLQIKPIPLPEELPDDVVVQFAAEDAVKLHFRDGKAQICMRIRRLEMKRRTYTNFEVRAPYQPSPDGFQAEFRRDGVIELVGDRLKIRDQIALRGIFTRVLSKNQAINLIPARISDDPRLIDLVVMQFDVRNGWVALAIGDRPGGAERSASRKSGPTATKAR